MRLVESEALQGVSRGLVSIEEERKRHEQLLQQLYLKYGKGRVELTLAKIQDIARLKPLIPRVVLLFWLSFFAIRNYHKLRSYALEMSEAMLSDEQKQNHVNALNYALHAYSWTSTTSRSSPSPSCCAPG